MADFAEKANLRITERIRRSVEQTFVELGSTVYLKDSDLKEFLAYRELLLHSLSRVEDKIRNGRLRPANLDGFPQVSAFPAYRIHAALFIGSFDPFQMSHLIMALRFLASEDSQSNVVFVVPEGSEESRKPERSDYRFRFEVLSLQLKDVFRPLVVPLDIGAGAGTMEIVRRFIALFPGSEMTLTHLLGSDALTMAALHMSENLALWKKQADACKVFLSYEIHAVARPGSADVGKALRSIRARGIRVSLSSEAVETPSSTDFRKQGAYTILFPSPAVLRRVEVLFRYRR